MTGALTLHLLCQHKYIYSPHRNIHEPNFIGHLLQNTRMFLGTMYLLKSHLLIEKDAYTSTEVTLYD
jgi:hypothetical protein